MKEHLSFTAVGVRCWACPPWREREMPPGQQPRLAALKAMLSTPPLLLFTSVPSLLPRQLTRCDRKQLSVPSSSSVTQQRTRGRTAHHPGEHAGFSRLVCCFIGKVAHRSFLRLALMSQKVILLATRETA